MSESKSNDLRYKARMAVLNSPRVGAAYTALNPKYRERRTSSLTQVVIDGYPRSGNTFAWHAFLFANPDSFVAGHTHAASQIRTATMRRIPTIVIVRHPKYAASSFTQLPRGPSLKSALAGYITYHEAIWNHLYSATVVPFEHLIHDFNTAITRCNDAFGSDFNTLDLNSSDQSSIAQAIADENARQRNGVRTRSVAYPSPSRPSADDIFEACTDDIQAVLCHSLDIYHRMERTFF